MAGLVLTRKLGEKLIIGDDITVQVVQVKGKAVRLKVDAPKHMTVHREEVYEEIKHGKASNGEDTSKD